MTSRIAMAVARDAMSITKNKTSRCRVVIPDDSIEESFAIRPLDRKAVSFSSEELRAVHTHNTVLSPVWMTKPTPEPLTQ